MGRLDRLEHVGDELRRSIEFVIGAVVFGERHVVFGDDGVGDIREGNAHVALRKMHSSNEAEGAGESDLMGPATATSAHCCREHSSGNELFHNV